ncbi:hypothetical protein BH20ACT24_BH20ACT24_21060 [soil metagenome]
MPQAVWRGSLSFGLVNIPVKVYSATSPKDIRFREIQGETGRRIRHRRTVETDETDEKASSSRPPSPPDEGTIRSGTGSGEARAAAETDGARAAAETSPPPAAQRLEVPHSDVVKGYEVAPDRYVTLSHEELASIAPEQTHSIEIEEFVDLAEIDPVFFERSYYVTPQPGTGGERPYWLLRQAMERAGKVGIARFVLRTKEYLTAIRPQSDVLVLETLFYADEVRDPRELRIAAPVDVPRREVEMAERFIAALSAAWDPGRHEDRYRERVLELVRAKEGSEEIVEAPEAAPPRVSDLMAALKASVEQAKSDRAARPARRRRETG